MLVSIECWLPSKIDVCTVMGLDAQEAGEAPDP